MGPVMLEGSLRKMQSQFVPGQPIAYSLALGDELLNLNKLLGQSIDLHFLGEIHCLHCQRKIKKSFNQGFCYPCFQKLPQADLCQVKPENCHFHLGTCRDSAWGKAHCFIDHTVYLANSSGLKVGITRSYQQVTRWIDQGAVAALPVLTVSNRKEAGLAELAFKQHIADKTNWQAMLKGKIKELDLVAEREKLFPALPENLSYAKLEKATPYQFDYPVLAYPEKVKAFNLDKAPRCQGRLMGIKGQYLILDTGVLNIRKFSGYRIKLQT